MMRIATAALLTALASLHVFAQSSRHSAPKPAVLSPLTPRERDLQLLNRFTFGPRPGDLEHLLAGGPDSPDRWLDQQFDPDTIPDAALAKRLADYPTLTMQPAEALAVFPDRTTIQQISEGKRPAPTDPQLAAVYEVQLAKYQRDLDEKKTLPNGQPAHPELTLTDDQKAAQKKLDQATAARIAGDLFALPRDGRMAALLKLSVADRIAFTGNVGGDQRNLLLSQFNPRERELFNTMSSGPGASYRILDELAQAKLLRSILSERQLGEVMTDFWFNHFNIFGPKDSDQWYTTSYERDAIRKHALGHFRDLLLATAQSPAMMVYLDNWLSVGPDSLANGVNPANPKSKRGTKGLNENYGREVMELHTVGVNGGYTQADVTALSAILTGWTVDRPNLGGPFLYDPKRHQPGPKQWLGHTIGSSATTPGAPSSPTVSSSERVGSPAATASGPPPKIPPSSSTAGGPGGSMGPDGASFPARPDRPGRPVTAASRPISSTAGGPGGSMGPDGASFPAQPDRPGRPVTAASRPISSTAGGPGGSMGLQPHGSSLTQNGGFSPGLTDPGQQEGLQALNLLAASPKTAHFISYLIAQRFLADTPPPAVVNSLAATYLATGGDIKAILRTLIQSPEFNSRQYFRNKVKTPIEFLASAFRSTGTDPANPGALVNTLRQMGMPVYNALPPTGYYITADHWMNSTALVDRLNFAYALTAGKYANQKFDSPRILALGLMAQPAASPAGPSSAAYHPVGSSLVLDTQPTQAGADTALHLLEDTLIGSDATSQTNQLIRQQTANLITTASTPTDTLNLLTALILGSPDFQRR